MNLMSWKTKGLLRHILLEKIFHPPFTVPCERGKKTRQTEEEVGRQHQEMDRPGVREVPEGSGKQGKMEKTGCKIICGASTTLAVKALMMIMIMMIIHKTPTWTSRS